MIGPSHVQLYEDWTVLDSTDNNTCQAKNLLVGPRILPPDVGTVSSPGPINGKIVHSLSQVK